MSVSIDPSLLLSNNTKTRSSGSNLGKDEFLKILMTQLQNQDPLNPMEDKEFISQMANFSSLEQITNMNSLMQKFLDTQKTTDSILKYSEMIGKSIEWSDSGAEEAVQTGVVKAIKQKNNSIILELDNGKEITSDLVTKISQPE
ncbi:flagellar hook assembly protein FlgD [Metabacillus litoralis]|uniref:flagellar hook assembly protein FlgD n=1 Tax=Metabacillus litoralis TaxID=152268 RepID=UPI00203F5748|nr:flagellar hook assembly protein FlgD [Metabacillus litoralis]MCM3409090.1 flagellar hook assembly protein FlgD [Metabacillus litoralis]